MKKALIIIITNLIIIYFILSHPIINDSCCFTACQTLHSYGNLKSIGIMLKYKCILPG